MVRSREVPHPLQIKDMLRGAGGKSAVETPNELAALPSPKPLSADDQPPTTLAQRCDRCGAHFNPRRGSGGSKQKFCSRDCQRTANRERQRTRRGAAYIAPGIRPAIPQPDSNEPPLRAPAVAALHPWETGTLDVANCQRTEFVVSLNEGESAGIRLETWPAEVRAFTDRHVTRWVEENKDKHTVRAMTVAAKNDGVHPQQRYPYSASVQAAGEASVQFEGRQSKARK